MREPALRWFHAEGTRPALDLAREEALLDGGCGPFLLSWSWSIPVLVLGFGQGTEGIALGACRRLGIPVLRRCSGGTGVIHRDDLSASLVLPPGHPWAEGIRGLYDRFVESLQRALAGCGVPTERPGPGAPESTPRSPICFEDRMSETLLWGERKVLGCAQARRSTGTLVHGTLLLRENSSLYAGVFSVSEDRVRAGLGPIPGGRFNARGMAERMARELSSSLGVPLRGGFLETCQEERAVALAKSREADPRWTVG